MEVVQRPGAQRPVLDTNAANVGVSQLAEAFDEDEHQLVLARGVVVTEIKHFFARDRFVSPLDHGHGRAVAARLRSAAGTTHGPTIGTITTHGCERAVLE